MVCARLHVICGNCGAPASELTHHVDEELNDIDGEQLPAVVIRCTNCSTLHVLEDTVAVDKNKMPATWLSSKKED